MTQWIKCSERLPVGGLHLAYRPGCKNEPVATIFYDIYMKTWGGKYIVTHWMPLPPPPEDEA